MGDLSEYLRIGQLGNNGGIFDNGLYTKGFIDTLPINILIDNGSTSTLLSYNVFEKIDEKKQLENTKCKLYDVNGKELQLYGVLPYSLQLGNTTYDLNFLVCQIDIDAILGQDFLLQYVNRIDYKRQTLDTEDNEIKCWIGGQANIRCRVVAKETVTIPARSRVFIPVLIQGREHLGQWGLVDQNEDIKTDRKIYMTRGVLDPHGDTKVQIVNFNHSPVTVQAQKHLGTCESYYEIEAPTAGQCNRIQPGTTSLRQIPEYLDDLYKRSTQHLEGEDKPKVADLLTRFQDVFAKSVDDLGRTDRVLHQINTGTAAPIRQPPRRLPLGKREIEKQEISKLLQRGVIEPSQSPWSSPVVLVTKKDGTPRLCIDYRLVNNLVINKDAYPLPRVDECLDSLNGAKWFSCLDLNQGFFQIGLDPKDREKTAFSTSQGLFQFTVTPFGLVTSPSVFERLMEDVLRGLQWVECLLYMDDIIVPASSIEIELERLEHVFTRLREANLKLKPSKCVLFQKSVKFLGHVVSESGVSTDPDKIKAIQDWQIPKNAKQIKSFLGLCGYYRRYVKGFADIARPLHKACKRGTKLNWTEDCQKSFDALRQAMMTPPILSYPVDGIEFILDTDASNVAVGAVLSQETKGQEHVIAYMSKALNKHEESYCTTRKELLAVVIALKNFHPYLYGQKIHLRTDNAAVSWLRNLKNPTGQVARWLEILGTYNLIVSHRSGTKHSNADALSRAPCKACKRQEELNKDDVEKDEDKADNLVEHHSSIETLGQNEAGENNSTKINDTTEDLRSTEVDQEVQPVIQQVRAITRSQQPEIKNCQLLIGWDPADIRQLQLSDENIGPIMVEKEADNARPTWEKISARGAAIKTLWNQWDRLKMQNGLLYRQWESDDCTSSKLQLILPKDKRNEVFKYCHDIPTAGHLGVEKTVAKVKEIFYWPSMKEHIENYCRECDQCFARKPKREHIRAPLVTYQAGEPMERIAMDILGPLPLTKQQNRYILVIMDTFTKWTEAIAISSQDTPVVANAFINNFVCRFGTPLQLHTDKGSNFESELFRKMCDLLGIDKTRTTSYRPQSNGAVERYNRTLTTMLSIYCEKQQNRWDEYLQQVMMAYRSSVHKSTSKTPNSMVFGREITLPLQAVISTPEAASPNVSDADQYVANLKNKLSQNYEIARKSLKQSSTYQKRHYDLKARKRSFKTGQPVWIYEPSRKVGVCSKLTSAWKGPCIVEKKIDDVTYRVRKSNRQPSRVYHIDKLALYSGRNIPSWTTRYLRKCKDSHVEEVNQLSVQEEEVEDEYSQN